MLTRSTLPSLLIAAGTAAPALAQTTTTTATAMTVPGLGPITFSTGPIARVDRPVPFDSAAPSLRGTLLQRTQPTTVLLEEFGLGILENGTAIGWGANAFGQSTPGPIAGPIEVAAGQRHSYVLRDTGALVAFGNNDFLQTNTPPSLGTVRRVTAGADHTAVILDDRTVDAWGCENCPFDFQITPLPAGITGAVSIDAEGASTFILLENGTITGKGPRNAPNFGFNIECGQENFPNETDFVDVAAGTVHGLGLRADGTIISWGAECIDSDFGQADVPNGLNDVVDVAAGSQHSVALRANGQVVCWGLNENGQTTVPANLPSDVVAVNADAQTTIAVLSDGRVIAWGARGTGNSAVPAGALFRVPQPETACGDADFNRDEEVNVFDILAFLDSWNTQGPGADFNTSGGVDVFDILSFLTLWNEGCASS